MNGRWSESPFLVLVLSLSLGIAASRLVTNYDFLCLVLATSLLVCASGLALYRNRVRIALASALGALILTGLALGLSRRDGIPNDDIRSWIARSALPLDEIVAFDGCVAEEVQRRGGEVVATIELHGFKSKDRWERCQGRVLVRMPDVSPDVAALPGAELRYGDRVRGWIEWNVPRNFHNPGSNDRVRFLSQREVFLLGRIKSPRVLEVLPGDCGRTWKRLAIAVRERLLAKLQLLAHEGAGREAIVLASLLIGDYSRLDPLTRQAFQNAGTYHVLVVSGLHVAWIAWGLVHLLRLFRFPPSANGILVACAIMAYSCIVGFQASISRCLWVFFLYLLGKAFFRKAAPINIVSASAFILLLARPEWLFDVGFQLSFLSVTGIFLLGLRSTEECLVPLLSPLRFAGRPERLFVRPGRWHRLGRRWRARAEILAEACGDRWTQAVESLLLAIFRLGAHAGLYLGGMVLISLSVQIWLGPVLAFYFNRLSWVSPLANLVSVPLSSLVLAAGMFAAVTADFIFPARFVLGIAGWSCALLLETTRWLTELPFAWQRCPTPSPFLVGSGLLLLLGWSVMAWRRIWIPCLAIGLFLGILGYGPDPAVALGTHAQSDHLARLATLPGVLRLTFLDVGQGDALVIRFPDTRVWILDAGGIRDPSQQNEESSNFDIGEAVVSRYLWSLWIRELDRIILSHPHQDHAGGMPALMRNFMVRQLDYGETRSDPTLDHLLTTARERRVKANLVHAGERHAADQVEVEVLNPAADGANRSINDNSVVLRLRLGRFTALLAGDLEKAGEMEMMDRGRNLNSILLKVAHHGSRTATLDSFLERVRPRWAVLSAGRNNPFGHPSREVLLRLAHHGVRPLLTLDQGAITLETDGERYVLQSHVSGILEQGILPP